MNKLYNLENRRISRDDILLYEVSASWWAELLNSNTFQSLAGRYFSWKVSRKYKRYEYVLERSRNLREQGY